MLEKLARQTAIYGISTILGRMLSYLLTPFYTRIFGVESYGIITDVYALIPFALVVLTMGMESSYFRFAAKAEAAGGDVRRAKQRLFATTWGITSLAATLFFVTILLLRDGCSELMGEVYVEHPEYVVIVAAIIAADVWGCIPFSRLREQGRALTFVALKLSNIILQVVLAVAFWAVGLFDTTFGVGWALVANLCASIVTTLTVVIVGERTLPRIDWRLLIAIFAYSMPLLLSGVAGTAGEFIDRQLIKYLVPEGSLGELGIYGAITKIAVVMTLFTQMYRLAAEPFFLANYSKEQFKEMNAAALKYYLIFSMAIFLVIALFRDMFALIVGRDFREGTHILPVVLGANILSGVWLNLSFWYKREEKTRFALWITLTGMVCSIIFGVLLIPREGYCGAAWSRFAAEVVMVVVSIALNRRYFPTPYEFGRMAEYVVLGLALYVAGESIDMECAMLRYTLYAILVVIYALYAVWREKIDVRALVRSMLKRDRR